jgi:hypothetical protein
MTRLHMTEKAPAYKIADLVKLKPAAAAASDKPQAETKTKTADKASDEAGTQTDSFYKKVNSLALANLGAWVPTLFPDAEERKGEKGWRVSSHALDRDDDLEEDLSLTPDGIKDFGIHDSEEEETVQPGFKKPRKGVRSPIDIVMQWGKGPHGLGHTVLTAALWLCEQMGIDPASLNDNDLVETMNQHHAVIPIGDKTRVVTFGKVAGLVGDDNVVMNQSFSDFKALQNKYHVDYVDPKTGEIKKQKRGDVWLNSPKRRQFDRGWRFLPHQDGNGDGIFNLWRGFGVKAEIRAGTTTGEAGCKKFLDFAKQVICSGNSEHFEYLIKREATIVQKRIRTEIALGLRSDEEGVGKGIYESTMRHLLGSHAMQVSNPEHILGKFNPHLETLLRLTADEALFVRNHAHRNSLFTLVTEPTLTIEPKGCGVYTAPSFLNLSITSNEKHFLPVSGTARRFFIPTVAPLRKQDTEYFADLKADLENGGYGALLYFLLNEVDLKDYNVRKVPRTEGLREQRDQGLEPLESWWVELLEAGVLTGSSLLEPHRAVSNEYDQEVSVGGFTRMVKKDGLFDHARQSEPRLKNVSDHTLGRFLKDMGCKPEWVRRRRGWKFLPLADCRRAWEGRYPGWKWRNPETYKWLVEE